VPEDDWDGWSVITKALGATSANSSGDDLFVTNVELPPQGHPTRRGQLDPREGEPESVR